MDRAPSEDQSGGNLTGTARMSLVPHPSPYRLASDHVPQFRAGFLDWLLRNPGVWIAFEREAMRIVNRGRRHYSARTILEVLRHESAVSERESEFKLNNNAAPDLSRLWALAHPEHAGLFETRSHGQRAA
jgi:hypothetical protein